MVATTTTTTTTKTTTMTALANRPAKRKLHARVPLSNQAIKLAFAAAVGRGEGPSTFLDSTREPRLVAVVVMATGSGSDLGGDGTSRLQVHIRVFVFMREEKKLNSQLEDANGDGGQRNSSI